MAIFFYKAKDRRGRTIEGLVDAVSTDAVAALLSEKNLAIINIEKKDGRSAIGQAHLFWRRVKIKDQLIFFRQLSIIVRANLPIVKALQILTKQTENEYFKTVIAGVAQEVDGGAKLSASLANFPDVFSDFQVSVIKSGETSGRLSEVVDYLADQQEKDYDLQANIRGAMIYPLFIVCGLVAVGFVIMTFVMPQMTSMLTEVGIELPWTTRVLIAVSNFFRDYGWLVLVLLVLLIGGTIYAIKNTIAGRRLFDTVKLRLPIFGAVFQKIYIIRIVRSFGTLLSGGVPVARALEVIQEVVGNSVYKDILIEAVKDVEDGNPVSETFFKAAEFPMIVPQMMSVGEETGRLDEVLEKITDFYSREVDYSIKNLSTMIEPVIMVILGVAVGFFIAAVIFPMWQLAGAV